MRWTCAIAFVSTAAGCAPAQLRPSEAPLLDPPNPSAASVEPGTRTPPIADSILLRSRQIQLRVGEEYDLLELTPPYRLYADGSKVQLWRWQMVFSLSGVYEQTGRRAAIRAARPGKADIVFLERSAPAPDAPRASGRVTVTVIP
jgi:hypothetical protein